MATAAGLLKTKEAETTIVLVSDGVETCAADPCAVMRKLKATGIKFVLHVVGFGVDAAAESQLRCMAEATSGRYFGAHDANSLQVALGSMQQEIAEKVEAARAKPRPAHTGLPKIVVRMPASAAETVAGLRILKAGGSPMKETNGLQAETVHPLPPGNIQCFLPVKTAELRRSNGGGHRACRTRQGRDPGAGARFDRL